MMAFRQWLFSIVAAAIVISVANALIPKGAVRSAVRCVSGLTLLMVLCQPFLQGTWENFHWEYAQIEEEIQALTEQYWQESYEEMKSIIEEKVGAYILDKAKSLGLTGEVVVCTAERDGIPYPVSVSLTVPYDETLSRYMTQELGLAREMQVWKGQGD